MIHVLGCLLLLLSTSFIQSSQSSGGKKLTATEKRVAIPSPTPGIVIKTEENKTAFLETSGIEFWDYLEDSPVTEILCPEEAYIFNELRRLGVKVFVTHYVGNTFKFKYKKSLAFEVPKVPEDSAFFHELYVFRNMIESQETELEGLWSLLNNRNGMKELRVRLGNHIQFSNLMQACLIMTLRPEIILSINMTDFLESVLVMHSEKNVYKHFIFKAQPVFFIQNFFQVYMTSLMDFSSASPSEPIARIESPRSKELLDILKFTLVDLKIPDEVVQEAFSYLTTSHVVCPIPILSVFVSSKRPLHVDQDALEAILLSGNDHIKERVALLKLNCSSEFISKIIGLGFSTGKHNRLIKSMLADPVVLSSLSVKMGVKLLNSVVKADHPTAIKFLFSTDLMVKLKQIEGFGRFICFAIDFVTIDSFRNMISAKLNKSSMPVFEANDILAAAFKALEMEKTDLVLYLIEARLVRAYSKFQGGTFIAAAVRANNLAVVAAFGQLDREKCPDIPISDNEAMQKLLESKFIVSKSSTEFSSPDHSPATTSIETISPLDKRSLPNSANSSPIASLKRAMEPEEPEVDPEISDADTHEAKKPRQLMATGDALVDFQAALEAKDDNFMCAILEDDLKRASLISQLGITNILSHLVENELSISLAIFTDFVSHTSVDEVLAAAINLGSELILERFLQSGMVRLEHVVGDQNIVASLFKAKKANLAFRLIEKYGFNLNFAHSPEHNPHGDIVLFTSWSPDATERLLQMGASPNVHLFSADNEFITLREWALRKNKRKLLEVLDKFIA